MRVSRPFSASSAEPSQEAPAAEATSQSTAYIPDVVFILARDGRILYVNQTLGGVPADGVAGSNLFDWIAPEQQEGLRDALDGVFRLGEPQGLELARLPQHQLRAWYECRINPTHRAGEVVSATLVARDITRHKLAGEELNRRYAEAARRADERREELAQVQIQLADLLSSRDKDGPFLHRFRSLLDAAGEAVFITDAATGAIVDVNGTACRWLRHSREEVLGRTAEQLGLEFTIQVPEGHDLSFTETRDTRRPAMVSGGVQRRQDGSTFPVEVAVARHRWGEEDYVLAVVRDVKEREYGLSALRQREAAYHDLFEQSWDGIYLTTRSGQIMAANPAAAALLGYAPDELTSLDARVLFAKPADIRRFQEAMAANSLVRDLDIELRRKDGIIVPALLSATRRYGSDGGIQGHQCLLRPRVSSPDATVASPATPVLAGPPVLVFEPGDAARREMAGLLAQAGVPFLEAASLARATELLREHAGTVAVVILGVEAGERGADLTIEEFRRIDPQVPVIVSSNEDRLVLAEQLADLEVTAFVDRPPHPLALVQRIRELATQRGAG
jgi:PAS domain S-box-containing protein